MEIIHIVFARKAKEKINPLVDIANQLATEQIKLGHSVQIWGIGSGTLDQLQQKPYNVICFSTSLFMWNTLDNMKKAINTIKAGTIIHIHGGIIPIFYPIVFHLHKNNCPFILSPHGRYNSYTLKRASYLKRKHFENFDTNIINWASAIHFVSEFERKELLDNYPFDLQKSYIIPNGLIDNNINIAPKIMKHDEIIYCYYGELSITKMGIDILLNAFSKFKKITNNNAVFWIIGNGGDRNAILKSIKKLGLHKYVFVKPMVYGTLKFEQLSKIDIMVRSSRLDYSPFVVLESASMSIPSIVSKQTYFAELIKTANAGYTLNENSVEELMQIFVESINDIESVQWNRKKMNARQMVIDHCSWKNIAREQIEVYKTIK
jgi:glycosyltransferase involved in cell wall biosynthesis